MKLTIQAEDGWLSVCVTMARQYIFEGWADQNRNRKSQCVIMRYWADSPSFMVWGDRQHVRVTQSQN